MIRVVTAKLATMKSQVTIRVFHPTAAVPRETSFISQGNLGHHIPFSSPPTRPTCAQICLISLWAPR